ncbi:glycosyltransferase family 4 protein [Haloarcula sp. JP-L23]|uniref:glycosyltransferase family 4 protein n=1 Tax=Haloarcula sp. JP-L23 TaxID=2716717 RepID=UPI0032E4F88A
MRVVQLPCPPLYPFHVDVHGVLVNRFLSRRADRFDLVHTHTPLTPVVQSQHPLVSTIHTSVVEDVDHVGGWNLTNLVSKLQLLVSSKRLVAGQGATADRITTVSGQVSRELARHYGIENATVVGNGVDADQFRPGGERDEEYLLYVGRLAYPKGIPDLLEAVGPIFETHDVELKITGKGPQREQLERQVERLDLGGDVTFTGYVSRDRQIRLYQNATGFVLPSHYEGLPTVLLEAMACGAPVVTTEVGGCPDIIEEAENGLLVPPGDPPALTDAIDTLLGDARLRDRLGAAARQTILEQYTWETITDKFEREYRLARTEQ